MHVVLSHLLPVKSATLWRWSVGWPLPDLLFFLSFSAKVLIAVHFWAELWWCLPSIYKWFVLQWMDEAGICWSWSCSYPQNDGLYTDHLYTDVLGCLLSSQHCWSMCFMPWHGRGSVGSLSFNQCCLKPFLRMYHLVCLIDDLNTHTCFTWDYVLDFTSAVRFIYSDSMFHIVCWLITQFPQNEYMELNINLTFHT